MVQLEYSNCLIGEDKKSMTHVHVKYECTLSLFSFCVIPIVSIIMAQASLYHALVSVHVEELKHTVWVGGLSKACT